ncbi:MAG: hypothetical protein WHV66_14325 [Anaerolineales bacterium]|jgi:hypothetical protein
MKILVSGFTWVYLDPGSGSFILQILLAALLGGAYAVKVYWKKIKGLFIRSSSQEDKERINADREHDE